VQQILARELPAIPLWFPDNNIVHTARIHGIVPSPDGSFDFLKEASVDGN
jgi:peptide/nickel transport system substrate-binding protein